MVKFSALQNYQHDNPLTTAVLLVNLGTPDAPNSRAVRRYLREFLSDPRVVEIPRPIWWLLLNGIILPFRAKKSAQLYQKIWTEQGSPLRVYTESIATQLAAALPSTHIAVGMCYGNPSLAQALQKLQQKQIKRLIVLPLYPQYSATTTGAAFDAITRHLHSWRYLPSIHFIHGYHDHHAYIQALAEQIRDHVDKHGKADKLLFSFHGIPERFFKQGDPYHCFCQKTARLVTSALGLSADQWQLSFQSRFGKAAWLQPYTNQTLQELGATTRSVTLICPGFAVDCLETLEEIQLQNRAIYLQHGGESFSYIPALNDSPAQIELLTALIRQYSDHDSSINT
jgi:protoporphyrin/coproporphyrin ferrochelatase